MKEEDREERFLVTYRIAGPAERAESTAERICLEQTVEVTPDLACDPWIEQHILGRVERIDEKNEDAHEVLISFPVRVALPGLPQLLNVLYGNISLMEGIRIIDLELPSIMTRHLGPRFGTRGVRDMLSVYDRPLLATALKPMGRKPWELAQYAYQFALGGIDIIKDDHGLADHEFCPFDERVKACANAIRDAEQHTGKRTLYFVNLVEPAEKLSERAMAAREWGADGLLLAPLLLGLDQMRLLASNDELDTALMAHPGLAGAFTNSADHGISHGVLLGSIFRLAGADMSIFPGYGGRFPFSEEICSEICTALRKESGGLSAALPVPAGGMRTDNIGRMIEFYGRDVVFLVGSDLYSKSDDLRRNAEEFLALVQDD